MNDFDIKLIALLVRDMANAQDIDTLNLIYTAVTEQLESLYKRIAEGFNE